MIRFQALTSWKLSEQPDGKYLEPALAGDHRLHAWCDVTGQAAESLLPEPNLLVIQAQADEETFAAVNADPACLVLWSKQTADM
jgi:hypothetical protein